MLLIYDGEGTCRGTIDKKAVDATAIIEALRRYDFQVVEVPSLDYDEEGFYYFSDPYFYY